MKRRPAKGSADGGCRWDGDDGFIYFDDSAHIPGMTVNELEPLAESQPTGLLCPNGYPIMVRIPRNPCGFNLSPAKSSAERVKRSTNRKPRR